MIPGIVAASGRRGPAGSFPDVLMDFIAGTYTVDGEAAAVADLLGGGFDPGSIDARGMLVGYDEFFNPVNNPHAIGALFEAVVAGVVYGCTIVAEWQTRPNPPFGSDNAGRIFTAFFGTDPNSDNEVGVAASQGSGASIFDDFDAAASAAANWNSGQASVQRVAATISRDTGGAREYAVSANGQAAVSDSVGYAQTVPVETVRLFGVEEWGESVDEWFIRKFEVKAPVAAADLAALSEVEAYPSGEPETGGSLSFLCHFNGTDGATAATDESANGHAITFLGNAQLDTAQAKFGASSLLLDGTGDAVSIANHASLLFGEGAFTVDIFFRMAAETDIGFIGVFDEPSNMSWRVAHLIDVPAPGDNFVGADVSSDGTTSGGVDGAIASLSTGVWNHVAFTRNRQGMMRILCNGVVLKNGYDATNFFASAAALVIGANDDLTWPLNGWIDEVRIWKGADLYNQSTTYTVPAAPFTP